MPGPVSLRLTDNMILRRDVKRVATEHMRRHDTVAECRVNQRLNVRGIVVMRLMRIRIKIRITGTNIDRRVIQRMHTNTQVHV